jgi:hypothetical protein
VASACIWAILQVTRRNPSATWTSQLARQVAAGLARAAGSQSAMSDNAGESLRHLSSRPLDLWSLVGLLGAAQYGGGMVKPSRRSATSGSRRTGALEGADERVAAERVHEQEG